jgi:HEAT repeats
MRTRFCICVAIGVALAARIGSLEGGSDQRFSKIASLIKQLGDDEFVVREAASVALEAIGEPALDALREVAASTEDAEIRIRARSLLTEAGLPNPKLASTFEPQAADFEFLHNIKGKSRKAILKQFGHPHDAEWHADGTERWTYRRTDGKLFWVFSRHGIATFGVPTDGWHIGGAEFIF